MKESIQKPRSGPLLNRLLFRCWMKLFDDCTEASFVLGGNKIVVRVGRLHADVLGSQSRTIRAIGTAATEAAAKTLSIGEGES